MKFGYIGIDYKHADQDIRDRVSSVSYTHLTLPTTPYV